MVSEPPLSEGRSEEEAQVGGGRGGGAKRATGTHLQPDGDGDERERRPVVPHGLHEDTLGALLRILRRRPALAAALHCLARLRLAAVLTVLTV